MHLWEVALQPSTITDGNLKDLVLAIQALAQPSIIDYAPLLLAVLSTLIALAAAAYARHQRNISVRAEKQAIHIELLDILYYLKNYSGELDSAADIIFKRLQKLKTISEAAFSKEARRFIENVLTKMHNMPSRKKAYENGVSKEAEELYNALGIDANIHDSLGIEYMNIKVYFSKEAFEEFEKHFSVNA